MTKTRKPLRLWCQRASLVLLSGAAPVLMDIGTPTASADSPVFTLVGEYEANCRRRPESPAAKLPKPSLEKVAVAQQAAANEVVRNSAQEGKTALSNAAGWRKSAPEATSVVQVSAIEHVEKVDEEAPAFSLFTLPGSVKRSDSLVKSAESAAAESANVESATVETVGFVMKIDDTIADPGVKAAPNESEAPAIRAAETPTTNSQNLAELEALVDGEAVVPPAVGATSEADDPVYAHQVPADMVYDVALSMMNEANNDYAFGTPVGPEALAELESLVEDSVYEVFDPETATFKKSSSLWATSTEPLDMRPDEPTAIGGDDYISELRALLVQQPTQQQQQEIAFITTSDWEPRETYPTAAVAPEVERYEIPREGVCETRGGDAVSSLFEPITGVSVPGSSTSRPAKPTRETAGALTKLKSPDDEACQYLGDAAPGYYFAQGDYVVTPPFRNSFPICHNPLYFEDPNLERCGVSNGKFTTVRSAGLFGAQLLTLPYQMTRHHPKTHVRALPDCPTCHKFGKDAYHKPIDGKATAVQLGVLTGLVFLIP